MGCAVDIIQRVEFKVGANLLFVDLKLDYLLSVKQGGPFRSAEILIRFEKVIFDDVEVAA